MKIKITAAVLMTSLASLSWAGSFEQAQNEALRKDSSLLKAVAAQKATPQKPSPAKAGSGALAAEKFLGPWVIKSVETASKDGKKSRSKTSGSFDFKADGSFSGAECVLYKEQYGYNALAHVANGVVYRGQYGYEAVAHFDKGVIYRSQYGYDAIGHYADKVIYHQQYGYEAVGHIDNQVVYRQQYGYAAVGHTTGCSEVETLAAGGVLLILGF